ncbi:MAG: hypothetical protein O7A04_02410 [Acidobacteria bacterium]|nr:hypothetical protein [Acidobacteriota bacterium]
MALELYALLLIALGAAVWLVLRHQNLRLRQMQHRERLAALEKGLATPQPQPHEGEDTMSDVSTAWKDPATYVTWFRLTTLGLAFLLLFGGTGMLVSFIIVEDPEMRKLWSLGLIPMMTGFGLFLFWVVSSYLLKKDD